MIQQSRFIYLPLDWARTLRNVSLLEELVDFGIDLLLLGESSLENGLLHDVVVSGILAVMKLVVIGCFDAHLLHYEIFQFE